MGIYEKTVYFHICANCGSLDWEEYTDGVENDYTTDENGETINFDENYYGNVVKICCHDCEKNSTHELTVAFTEWKKIYNMKEKDRLVHIIKLMSERKMERDEGFIEEVIKYHKNSKRFMTKISEYLQTLGYTETG